MKCEWCPPKLFQDFPKCFQWHRGSCHKGNPGNIQSLHLLAHKVMPKFFDGIELDYIHRIDSNKILTNNWILSHTRPSGYRIGGIYAFRYERDHMLTPLLYANINPSTLSSNVGFVYFPFECMRIEGDCQRGGEDVPLDTQLCVEITRPCTTYTMNFYNVRHETGRCTLSLMRALTKHWALGGEFLMEWTNPNSIMADTALAARYRHYNYSIAATASRQGCDISYWQRLHENIQMATTLAWHRKSEKAIATISYQWNFEDSVVRGKIDSDLAVGFSYYRYLQELPCGLGLSVLYSLALNRFIFGMKITVDPSGLRRGA